MHHLILYTKLNCHLCEEAYGILMELVNDFPMQIDIIDLNYSTNADLVDFYHDRIPVIRRPEATADLAWPFTATDVKRYLTASR